MRTLLALGFLASLLTLPNLGCLGCSAYSGGGDVIYARGQDQLILCENTGFVATINGATIEGKYSENAPGSSVTDVGTEGDNGKLAFDLTVASDGTATAPELGSGAWTEVSTSMNQVELDHADILCKDLVNRAWWGTP